MSKRTIATVVLTTFALSVAGLGTATAATKSTRTVVTKSVTKVSQPSANARSLAGPAAAFCKGGWTRSCGDGCIDFFDAWD